MRISYLLPHPELGGGNKVALQHAQLLAEAGHQVTVAAAGERPPWTRYRGPYLDYSRVRLELPSQDLVVATFWTTIEPALALGAGPVAHFCQGFEGDLVHLRAEWPRIEAAYRLPLPALTVGSHLAALLATRFGRDSRVVSPPLDPLFRPARLRRGPRRPPWIAVPGIFAAEVKDVATALRAVVRLRREGLDCRLLRFSILPLDAAERSLLAPDRYLVASAPAEVAAALRTCDLLLFPSRPAEGFGLPLLEACASGVPAVATRIPSVAGWSAGELPLVPVGDDAAFAREARTLLGEAASWRRARRRGLALAAQFAPQKVLPGLEAAVRWAVDWWASAPGRSGEATAGEPGGAAARRASEGAIHAG